MKKYSLNIEGMHCASCASNIERVLKKITGVRNVSVALLMKRAVVEADESVKKEQLKEAVAKTGYKVIAISE